MLNCSRCTKMTSEYVSTATGLEWHCFHRLEGDHEIGAIKGGWNHLVDVQAFSNSALAPGSANSAPWWCLGC